MVVECNGFISCNSQQNWLNHILIMFFCWSIVVDQFFSDLFLIWYPAQSGCFEYVLYDSSRPCHCVDDPDIHFHPYSPKGYASISTLYPLYSIPGMLQQSGRRILHTKCISRSGHGQLQHLSLWPRQGGGRGRWWRMCRSSVVLRTRWQWLVTEVSDTRLPAFSSVKWSLKMP